MATVLPWRGMIPRIHPTAFVAPGAVVIETVFSRQGLGRLIVNGILAKDFPLVQGAVLFTAMMYVLVNLVVDIAYAWVDPRIHYE